ncbi:MAG: fumarylacetoacetate hydrolase family protein [Acidobacteriota bacterium]|nr:fumarylacetoacetate hydrolase family protein [Acidobacteriota bacterium]
MIFVTFESDDGLRLGVKSGKAVIDLARASEDPAGLDPGAPRTPAELFALGLGCVSRISRLLETLPAHEIGEPSYCLEEASLVLGPPVPRPGKIICVGRNYREHAAEMDADVPQEPLLFSKFGNAIVASGRAIDITGLTQVDYEAELAVVIGRRGKRIDESEALEHVFGYCNANDVSDRSLQYRSSQFLLGKSLDGFLPIGPYLMTADELSDPQDLPIRGWLNGELRQESHTSRMVFPVAFIVSYISRYMTLEPGDLILTGTPEGVIKGREDGIWMQPGDEYVVEVGPLGRLSNRLVGD